MSKNKEGKTFSHGFHIPDYKELSSHCTITALPLPTQVLIPLAQHIGAPAKCCVEVGQRVLTGQKIGEQGGFVSVNIHSSISGIVKDIRPFLHPLGRLVESVLIESDGKDEWLAQIERNSEPGFWQERTSETALAAISSEEITKILPQMGIVGMGGATFPTHVKMTPPEGKVVETLIVNGVECEPYLTADHRLMLEETPKLLAGIKLLMKACGAKKVHVGIEMNKPDVIDLLRAEWVDQKDITIEPLQLKYPQGAEKQLIKSILNREVPSGGLPLDVGVVVNNVGTAAAVADAVLKNKPLFERVLTVTGEGVARPQNLLVRVGTSFEEVLQFCGGLKPNAKKILMGGPMMGLAQYSTEVPVIKGTSGILVLLEDKGRIKQETNCLRCGHCLDLCPMMLNPSLLGLFARAKEFSKSDKFNVLDCMECGTCAYGCPAKIPLVHLMRFAKGEVLAQRRKMVAK